MKAFLLAIAFLLLLLPVVCQSFDDRHTLWEEQSVFDVWVSNPRHFTKLGTYNSAWECLEARNARVKALLTQGEWSLFSGNPASQIVSLYRVGKSPNDPHRTLECLWAEINPVRAGDTVTYAP
jgi:hypothetical protein